MMASGALPLAHRSHWPQSIINTGGRDLTGDGDSYVTAVSRLTLASGIRLTSALVGDLGAGFAFPNTVMSNSGGRFGLNLQFRDAAIAMLELAS